MDIQSFLSSGFGNALVRFVICTLVNWVIVDRLYFKKSTRRDFYFTFILISIAIYFLVFFMMGMDRGKATMGVGLGLFGIFSIMRYRTDTMPVREMTYLFIVICLSVVHAMVNVDEQNPNYLTDYGKLIVVDAIILAALWTCERKLKVQASKLIQYDRPELTVPDKYDELVDDLEKRTGLRIEKVDVGGYDFLKDTVVLRVTYQYPETPDAVDNQYKVKNSQWREV